MMRKLLLLLTVAILVAGLFAGFATAGRGKGPGNGTGIGRCVCDESIDIDPVDGICDICGGCIPIGDGPCVCDESVDVDPADGICDVCGGCIPAADGPSNDRGGNGRRRR